MSEDMMVERKRAKKDTFSAAEVGALIEDLRFQFTSFGEGLEDMRGRMAALEAEMKEIKEPAEFFRIAYRKMSEDIGSLTTLGRKTTADIAAIRDDIRSMKDHWNHLEARVTTVEGKVGL